MDDDIDIEEHDVLDNPHIRTLFPDLAQIKKEIPDVYHHDPDSRMEYQPYSKSEKCRQYGQEDTSKCKYARCGNKIVLGSKPSSTLRISEDIQNGESVLVFERKSVEIKQEADEYEETTDEVNHPEDVHEETHNSASTVLILGSKPSSSAIFQPLTNNVHEETYNSASTVLLLGRKPSSSGVFQPLTKNDVSRVENELAKSKTKLFDQEIDLNCENNDSDNNIDTNDPKDPTAALVLAENWGPRLENSSCYCKECLILFPTSNRLLAHMTAHSFLVAVDKNKAEKFTAKPNVKKVSNDSGKFCNHCNKIFPDSESLINHLYEKLTFDKNNAVFKPQPKKAVPNPSSKEVLPKQLEDDAEFGSEMQVYDQEAVDLFQCQVCSIYLEIYGLFVRHMFNNHSKTEFSEEKTLFNGTCLFCNTKVKNKLYYNKHIKLFHPEVFNYKGPLPQAQVAKKLVARKNPIPKVVPQTQSLKFQCQKCNAKFLSYGQARQHRATKHPDSSAQNIFKKITSFKNKTICVQKARVPFKEGFKNPKNLQKGKVETQTQPEIIPSTSKSSQKFDTSDIIDKPKNLIFVPQSVLFKCNKCPMHFTSCTSMVLHVKACGKQKGDWKCHICHRDFQNFDQTVHMRQHQISENFYVIPYYECIYGRVLNQCPNCELYFHEKDFYLHEQISFCRGDCVKCDQCAFPIHTSSVEVHAKWHERIDINKKNVIVVEFGYVSENKTLVPAKRELEFIEQGSPAKKVRRKELTTVHYCQTCGLFMFRRGAKYALYHVTGKCKHLPIIKKKQLCKICGLTYASSSHTVFHKEHPEITLMDMKFVSVKNREAIAPPIPVFPSCNKCKVHFCKQDTVLTHNCNDSYKTCKYCQKSFSDLAFKLHVRFHDYIAKFKASKSIDLKKTKAKTHPEYLASPRNSKMTDPLPELLKNYEKLTDFWNILFSCETCDIVCDNYDRAVEHCQNHFNNMESYDMIILNCERCHLKFDGSCFEKHAELHAQNKKITKDSFTIVKYRYTKLLRSNWFLQFKCLPDSQLQQMLSRSIYRHGRSVKLRVVGQGTPEITIYRCEKCKTFVHPHVVSSHYKSVACNKKTQKFDCRLCGVLYNSAAARDHHQELHKMDKTFTVVYFNEDGDDEFNEKLRENDQVHVNHFVGTRNGNRQSKVYRFYMCIKCKCCRATAMSRKYHRHRCPDATKIERCKICHLYFNVSILTRHTKFHELNPKLSKKNIICIPFRPEPSDAGFKIEYEANNEEIPTAKLYKCQCGLHFTSTNAAEKHFKSCGEDSDTAKEKCSKCNRLFDTTQLVTHLCKHHSKDKKNTKFEIIKDMPIDKSKTQDHTVDKSAPRISDKRKTLYKCRRCDICYLTASGLAYHFDNNHQDSKIRPCPHCQLKFTPMTLRKHITLQHQLIQCKAKDFIIRTWECKDGLLKILDIESKPVSKASKKIINIDKVNPKSDLSLIKPVHRSEDLIQYKATLHKCGSCGTHYINASDLDLHQEICQQHTNDTVVCGQCQLRFSLNGLETHVETHHKSKQLKLADFKIIDYGDDDNIAEDDDSEDLIAKDTEENSNEAFTLSTENEDSLIDKDDDTSESKNTIANKKNIYQCGKCKSCFNSNKYIKQHYAECKCIQPNKKCNQCQLMFPSNKSLNMHINRHHKSDHFKFYVILVNYDKKISQVVKTVSSEKPLEITENVSTLVKELYTNQLFKCNTCSIHFLLEDSLEMHTKYPEVNIPKSKCTCCGLIFSVNTLPTHIFIHHEKMKLSAERFDITSKKEYMDDDSNLLHSVNASNEEMASTSKDIHSSKDAHVTDTICIDDTESDDENETVIKKAADVVSTVTPADSLDTNVEDELENSKHAPKSSRIDPKESKTANTIRLYKCAVCNVCFLSQTSCYKHVTKHITLNPKDYIECKLCGYQFLILNNSLNKHVTKHHRSNFKPEDVLIEEYNPNVLLYGSPKINIYCGTNKVQSKLISTTSDANVSSYAEDSEKDVKTSDNVTINLDSSVESDRGLRD